MSDPFPSFVLTLDLFVVPSPPHSPEVGRSEGAAVWCFVASWRTGRGYMHNNLNSISIFEILKIH